MAGVPAVDRPTGVGKATADRGEPRCVTASCTTLYPVWMVQSLAPSLRAGAAVVAPLPIAISASTRTPRAMMRS